MLLELTEILRCPRDHEESYVVCVAYGTEGRHVVRGVVGCPQCQAEYPIRDGVLDFSEGTGAQGHGGTAGDEERSDAPAHRRTGPAGLGGGRGAPEPPPERRGSSPEGALTAEALATFLDLRGPGGYVLFAGGATRLAAAFAALVPGVHVVAVNAPPAVAPSAECSWIVSPGRLPVKASQVRGAVLGSDCAVAPWPGEAARTLLRGLRIVIEDERASPDGISELARGAGVFVGEKAGR